MIKHTQTDICFNVHSVKDYIHPAIVLICEFKSLLKGACSDPRNHPPAFFKHLEILVPEVESYLQGFMCEISCAKSV